HPVRQRRRSKGDGARTVRIGVSKLPARSAILVRRAKRVHGELSCLSMGRQLESIDEELLEKYSHLIGRQIAVGSRGDVEPFRVEPVGSPEYLESLKTIGV